MRTVLASLWEEMAEKVYEAQGLLGTAEVYRQAALRLREAAAELRPFLPGEEETILLAIAEAQERLGKVA